MWEGSRRLGWKKGKEQDWEANIILWGEKNQSRFPPNHNLGEDRKIVREIIKYVLEYFWIDEVHLNNEYCDLSFVIHKTNISSHLENYKELWIWCCWQLWGNFLSKSKWESHLNSKDLCLNPSCFSPQMWDLLKDPQVSKHVKPVAPRLYAKILHKHEPLKNVIWLLLFKKEGEKTSSAGWVK